MISVIIPAHNEAAVIERSLAALFPGVESGQIQVIVVCNGCTDNTAQIVRSLSTKIICLETPVPSKTNALNIGEGSALFYPRLYLDADVVLSASAIIEIGMALQGAKWLAAAPVLRMDYTGTSWFVRSYYKIWLQLPYVQAGMIGTGAFALSEKGRARFDAFPDIIADDGYVRALFLENERISVEKSQVLVKAPSDIKGLLKIKTRSRLGRYELSAKYLHLLHNEDKDYVSGFLTLLRKPQNWPMLPIYFLVNVVSRIRAKAHCKRQGYSGWERDDSSRQT